MTQPPARTVTVSDRGQTRVIPVGADGVPVIDVPQDGRIKNTSDDSAPMLAAIAFMIWAATAWVVYMLARQFDLAQAWAMLIAIVVFVIFAAVTLVIVTGHLPGILSLHNERMRITKQAELAGKVIDLEADKEDNRHAEAKLAHEAAMAQITEQNAVRVLQEDVSKLLQANAVRPSSKAHIDMVPERNAAHIAASDWLRTMYDDDGYNADTVHKSGAIKKAPFKVLDKEQKRIWLDLLVGPERPLTPVVRNGTASGYTLNCPTLAEALRTIKT